MTKEIREGEPDARLVYADIIDLPHWKSQKRPHMGALERAAQFSPFAALTGYEDMIDEEAREVGAWEPLSETALEILNAKITRIAAAIEEGVHPVIRFEYFIEDAAKDGGSYVSITERVRRIDTVGRRIQLFKQVGISKSYMELEMGKIRDISGELVDDIG